MKKDNVVKFPTAKENKHLQERNEYETKVGEIEEYVQYLSDALLEELIIAGYDMENPRLMSDMTVCVNLICAALCRTVDVTHFGTATLDVLSGEIEKLVEESDDDLD